MSTPPRETVPLVELTRGTGLGDARVESRHFGTLSLARPDGPVLTLGPGEVGAFPRSAVKTFQALPLVTTGAAERFDFAPADLSLAQASHDGSSEHAARAAAMLATLGLDETALACGAPFGRHDVGPLHHECSGKHAGMLAVARHLGADTNGYERADHPVQRAIKAAIEAVTGAAPDAALCGVDGCSVPTWALPLDAVARGMAVLGAKDRTKDRAKDRAKDGEKDGARSGPWSGAGRVLREAVHAAPAMIWGEGRFDAEIARRFGPRAFAKRGAEGVYCAILAETDGAPALGLAIKIEDGAHRAAKLGCAAVLNALLGASASPEDAAWLRAQARRPILTAAGATVGEMRATLELTEALARL